MSNLVVPSGKLKADLKSKKAKIQLKDALKDVPNIQSKKFDLDLIRYALSIANEIVSKKINVKELVIEILLDLIPHGPDELQILKGLIDFLQNHKLVPKVPLSKKVFISVLDWVKRKFL